MKHRFKIIVTDILVIAFAILFPHFGGLPMFAFPFVVLGLIWLYLRLHKQNFSSIGFKFSDINVRAFLIGGSIGIAYAVFAYWVLGPLLEYIGFKPANVSDFAYLRHNFKSYVSLVILASVLVIPFEEIVFRGFIFSKIKDWFGLSPRAFIISAIASSILFAAYHYQEGVGAMTGIFIFSLFEMWLYKIFKGNLWYLIFFHILYDVFMLGAIWQAYM